MRINLKSEDAISPPVEDIDTLKKQLTDANFNRAKSDYIEAKELLRKKGLVVTKELQQELRKAIILNHIDNQEF